MHIGGSMASKLVTDRQKGAEAVAAVGTAQSELLARALGEALGGPSPKGAGGVDAEAVVGALSQKLAAARDAMVAADAANESELSDDAPARARRDDAASALGARINDLRSTIRGLYGEEAASSIVAGPTPTDATMLARFAGEVVSNLRTATFGTPRLDGATFAPSAAANAIEAGRAVLADALKVTAREEREGQVTLAEKTRAIAEYDRVFRGVATVFNGLLVLAGEDDLARKVRPSVRRPGRTVEQAEAEETEPEA